MAETMDVGVVVPLYNKAASVRQSVERLLDQSVRPARVVVVDDGSSDGGGARLDPLAERLTLVRQPNAGPSAARNRGASLLRTEWVAFADADNLWDVRRLERVRAFLQRPCRSRLARRPLLELLPGRPARRRAPVVRLGRRLHVLRPGRRPARPALSGNAVRASNPFRGNGRIQRAVAVF